MKVLASEYLVFLKDFGIVMATITGLYSIYKIFREIYLKYRESQKKKLQYWAKIDDIHSQWMRNGGSSARDSLDRLEVTISEIRNSIKHIQDSQTRKDKFLAAVLTTLHVGYWEADSQGHFTTASIELCNIMGRSEAEILGDNWTNCVAQRDRERVKKTWEESTALHKDFKESFKIKRRDGRELDVLATAYHLTNNENISLGFFGVLEPAL